MTQYLTDLAQRCAMTQHLGGQPMAELMGSGCGSSDASTQ
jgi:hypothetical protein